MKKIYLSSIILMFFSLNSCHKTSQKIKIETSDKNRIEIKIKRFDKDLIQIDRNNSLSSVKEIYKKYPDFLPLYTFNILEIDAKDTIKVSKLFLQFVSDTAFEKVNTKVLETFNDVTDIEKDLSDAFSIIHQTFPEITIPQIHFYVSGFNRAVMMTDNILAVGTDFYLGEDYAPYKEFTYDYLLHNMRREMISIDITTAFLFKNFGFDAKQNRLIDNMLYRGKILYVASQIMSEKKTKDILGYSTSQMEWAEKNESEIWKALVGQKHLFSTDVQLIGKYINDAPFTAPITQESPGRLGVYIGWKIVDSYMKNNKDVSLKNLIKTIDYQKMLEISGYRP